MHIPLREDDDDVAFRQWRRRDVVRQNPDTHGNKGPTNAPGPNASKTVSKSAWCVWGVDEDSAVGTTAMSLDGISLWAGGWSRWPFSASNPTCARALSLNKEYTVSRQVDNENDNAHSDQKLSQDSANICETFARFRPMLLLQHLFARNEMYPHRLLKSIISRLLPAHSQWPCT